VPAGQVLLASIEAVYPAEGVIVNVAVPPLTTDCDAGVTVPLPPAIDPVTVIAVTKEKPTAQLTVGTIL
jgi:hypothetical protein